MPDEERWLIFCDYLLGATIRGLKRRYKGRAVEEIIRECFMILKRDRKRVKRPESASLIRSETIKQSTVK